MPTTTNFGWTTPADTDLVKDGAAAIRTLGSNIDTSLVDLNGGTTGQYLQKNSDTDLDYVWGDVSAGGMTLISTTTLTGASVTLSSIPATYNNLYIVIRNQLPVNDGARITMRINSDSGSNRYKNQNPGSGSSISFTGSNIEVTARGDNTVGTGLATIFIPDYSNTTTWKITEAFGVNVNESTNTNFDYFNSLGFYNQTAAISSLQFLPASGNFTSGELLLYGVK